MINSHHENCDKPQFRSGIGIIPEDAYRCLILDSDNETARFQEAKNNRLDKRLYNIYAPAAYPISGLR